MTTLETYSEIQPFVQKDATDIVSKIIEEKAQESQYKVPSTPFHTHNGTDSPQIDFNNLLNTSNSSLPSGAMLPYGGSSAPTGYLLCNGSAVSRTTYSTLFTAIGTTFGIGDGSTTFNIPDGRANVLGGYKSGDTNFGTLGGTGGEATHVLTTAEMPAHTHSQQLSLDTNNGITSGSAGTRSTNGTNTGSTGGGGAHNNLQPYLTINWIIKT